jgi:hypothetical protein
MTPKSESKTKGKGNGRGRSRLLHCVPSLRERTPVGMTPKFKSKSKGKSKGNRRFLRCTFAPARTFRSE